MRSRSTRFIYFALIIFVSVIFASKDSLGGSLIPDEFTKLKIGMSWNEAIHFLPSARDSWSDFDQAGSGKLIPDHPKSSIEYWAHKPEKILITVLFTDGVITTKIFCYNRKDSELTQSLRSELEKSLGSPLMTDKDKNGVQIIKWDKDDLNYSLCIPSQDTKGGGIAFGVVKKKTEQGAAANP
jgi:hypothetical protein